MCTHGNVARYSERFKHTIGGEMEKYCPNRIELCTVILPLLFKLFNPSDMFLQLSSLAHETKGLSTLREGAPFKS